MGLHETGPRVGIFGFFGETTSFRRPYPADSYKWMAYYEDATLVSAVYDEQVFLAPETRGFFEAMDRSGPWQPLTGLYALSASGPHLDETHFQSLLAIAARKLDELAPLDGVFINGHGSFVATATLDTDAALLRLIRDKVGPDIPIVMTLDLHGKLTPEMLELGDLFVTYQTDPHVDMRERGIETGEALRRMMRTGERPGVAHIRLPIMIPTVGIVAPTSPFVEGMANIVEAVGPEGHASILPSYPYTDTPYAGFYVLSAHWSDQALAERVCREAAEFFWERREGFVPRLMDIDTYAALARDTGNDASLPPLCFADVGDNPGGGATGNTTYALRALLEAGVTNAAIGPIHDAAGVAKAVAAGIGSEVSFTLNEGLDDLYAKPLALKGRVTALADGQFSARAGPARGVAVSQGTTAAVQVDGVTVVLCSIVLQALAVEQFEMVGVDFEKLRTVTVKSRGHYQASFSEFYPHRDMIAIDAPGWTSPNLSTWPYRRIGRPLFPLDRDTRWRFDGFTYARPPRRVIVDGATTATARSPS